MSHEHREADGQGGGAEAAVASLVGHGEDADHQLHGEEDLHGGSHAHADAWLQLQGGRAAEGETKEKTVDRVDVWPEANVISDICVWHRPHIWMTLRVDRLQYSFITFITSLIINN